MLQLIVKVYLILQALSDVAKSVAIENELPETDKYNKPTHVVTRGLLKK